MASTFTKLCIKHKVTLVAAPEFVYKYRRHLNPHDMANLLHSSSSIQTPFGKFILYNIEDDKITKWHEMGHILHPLGGFQRYNHKEKDNPHHTLVAELAASYWALTNFDHSSSYENARNNLIKAARTYIENDYGECANNDTYRIMARKIGVEDEITWINY